MFVNQLLPGILLAGGLLAQAPPAWTPEYSMKVKNVGDVTPSPDGKWVAWTETRPVMEGEKSEMLTHIWLARGDASDRWQLTRGDKSATSPAFSPDGMFVFFASNRGAARQIFRIAVDGGEAEAVTSFQGVIGTFAISPDGKWVAFTGRETDSNDERAVKEKRDWKVADENPRNQSLYVTAVEPGLDGKRAWKRAASGPYNIGNFDWSPDSRRIAYETRPTPGADDGRKADIWEVEVETAKVTALAATPGTEAQPRYSPDGRYLAFVRGSGGSIAGAQVALLTRAEGKVRDLPKSFDESPALLEWSPDSRGVFFHEGRGAKRFVYALPVDGPPVVLYAPAKGTAAPSKIAGFWMGLTIQASDEPVEAYVMDVRGGGPRRVSAANSSLPLPPLGKTDVIRWRAKDGREVEGLVTYPVGYEKGKRYPLILNIHGGPAGAFGESFIGAATLYPIATFAAKGWVTLRPNPRGSTGYGLPFRAANRNDWGGGDYGDIMAGVDYLIAQGVADENRMAVMGWSYGGYMTNWVVGQTQRFKAAVSGAGISSLVSMWGTNDIPTTLDDYFEGAWFEQPDRYIRMSPLKYVDRVTTPFLVLHGGEDLRVPLTQGIEMYEGVKRRGTPAQMVVYPRTPHGPQEPKFLLDIMQRHVSWVQQHVR
ncbi:MAG: S9 family peptidase [Bryobacteraceae bacterium]|nr:S9 family peptidase [Bryobacteraceae bacterium]